MNTTTHAPPTTRRTVLDPAHVGDIHGALGTVAPTTPRRGGRFASDC